MAKEPPTGLCRGKSLKTEQKVGYANPEQVRRKAERLAPHRAAVVALSVTAAPRNGRLRREPDDTVPLSLLHPLAEEAR